MLLNKSYKEGKEKRDELDTAIESFIRMAFRDGKEKLVDYRRSSPIYIGILGHEDTEEGKHDYYLGELKSMRNNLIA